MIDIASHLDSLQAQSAPPPAGPPQRLWQNPRPYPSSPGGRPRKLDEQAKELVCCLVNKGHTLSEAAAFVACDRNTILNERKRDPQFDANVKRARRMRMYDPLDAIARASRTSWRAAAWLAEFHRRTDNEARERRLRRLEAKARLAASPGAALPETPPQPSPASGSAQNGWKGSFLAPTPDAQPDRAPADSPAPRKSRPIKRFRRAARRAPLVAKCPKTDSPIGLVGARRARAAPLAAFGDG
jgi:hypothetical protein